MRRFARLCSLTIQHVLQFLPVYPEPLLHPLGVQTLLLCALLAWSPFFLLLILFFVSVALPGLAGLRSCRRAGSYATLRVRLLRCYGGPGLSAPLGGGGGGHSRTEPSSVCVYGCVDVCMSVTKTANKQRKGESVRPPLSHPRGLSSNFPPPLLSLPLSLSLFRPYITDVRRASSSTQAMFSLSGQDFGKTNRIRDPLWSHRITCNLLVSVFRFSEGLR